MVQHQFIKCIKYNHDKELFHLWIKSCQCGCIRAGDVLIILPFLAASYPRLAPMACKSACFDVGTQSDGYVARPQLAMLPFFGITLLHMWKTRKTLQDIVSVSAALNLIMVLWPKRIFQIRTNINFMHQIFSFVVIFANCMKRTMIKTWQTGMKFKFLF